MRPETLDNIHKAFELISNGMSAKKACEELRMSRSVFHAALMDDKNLSDKYARACEIRASIMFDEINEIADEATHDVIESEGGGKKQNTEFIQRSKLRVDARKWTLARMNPRKYGDRVNVDHDAENKGVVIPQLQWRKPEE